MLSPQSLGAWAVAGALFYATLPRKPKELSKKDIDDANRNNLAALAQANKAKGQE
jgi:hypothetical protein